ncbi:hypothetical protein EJ994_02390 [Maribacter sp. MJ134]|uniref:DoxX-like family protein n=1 Tax=Maribacter sp. MJ134 TaxID=2496865 RepID=UPI000F84422D|nr:DoxX-like family protein [Maribacter sp. MJ134]AZQ57710.1 hypothetical protein EJ994_02390 [Maribacter sp. MJ134]
MHLKNLHKVLNYSIASIWLVNGLVCKVLNFVPRHQQIVAEILGNEHSRLLTIAIGFSEIIMAIWVISQFKSRINAVAQIIIVALMNLLEFILVPELLLWGKLNSFFALLFIGVVYYNEFILKKELP